jgi:hypothetical protein
MDLREWAADFNAEALFADGFDQAILGMCEQFGKEPVVAYDREKCIQILMDDFAKDGNKGEDEGEDLYGMALEYFDFNVTGAYVGVNTPVFLTMAPSVVD